VRFPDRESYIDDTTDAGIRDSVSVDSVYDLLTIFCLLDPIFLMMNPNVERNLLTMQIRLHSSDRLAWYGSNTDGVFSEQNLNHCDCTWKSVTGLFDDLDWLPAPS
jgi:hypothetical protein